MIEHDMNAVFRSPDRHFPCWFAVGNHLPAARPMKSAIILKVPHRYLGEDVA